MFWRQIKRKTDEELTKKGVIIQKSDIKMTTTGNIEYTANYKHRPKQFGIAIGAIVSAIIKAIIQAVKAIIRFIINAIKQLISYIQKLTMKLITQLKDLSGKVLGGGSEQKDIDLKNPEGSLEEGSDDGLIPKTKTAINPLLIAIAIIVIAFFFFKK
jgi:predicted PurR-regulated permease PerM